MREPVAIRLGDLVKMRKPHACGANEWTVVRTGADIRVRCEQCGRTVLMSRARFVRAAVGITPADAEDTGEARPLSPPD